MQVSFAEHRLFYRALLQKRPIILWRLLAEATQCVMSMPRVDYNDRWKEPNMSAQKLGEP